MIQPLHPERILARRRARIAFGATLVVGVITLISLSALDHNAPAGLVVAAVWATAGLAWLSARVLPAGARALGAAPTTPVSAGGPTAAVHARALGVKSVAMPLMGLAAMAPFTLHALVALFLHELDDFSEWVVIGALLTTHVQLFFAFHGYRFARALEAGEVKSAAIRGVAGVSLAAVVACLPGAILFMVPPLIVLFTGLLFAPLAYHLLGARFTHEQSALA